MEWVALVGLGLNLIVLIVGVVWVIGKINTQAAVLAEAVNNLNTTLLSLKKWVGKIDEKVDSHGERLATVEAKQE
jgi:predicted PurR-regulated permease PerM